MECVIYLKPDLTVEILDVNVFSCYRTFDCAIEEWRQLHCGMNDLSQWLADTETLLSESIGPDGQLDSDSTRQQQQVRDEKSEVVCGSVVFTRHLVLLNPKICTHSICQELSRVKKRSQKQAKRLIC